MHHNNIQTMKYTKSILLGMTGRLIKKNVAVGYLLSIVGKSWMGKPGILTKWMVQLNYH